MEAVHRLPPLLQAVRDDQPGTVVRLFRQAAHLSQAELGAMCGYSGSTISRLENGQPPLHHIAVRRRLAQALDIPDDYLGLSSSVSRHDTRTAGGSRRDTADPATLHRGPSEGGEPMKRRTLLAGMAGSTVAGIAMGGPAAATPGAAGLEALLFSEDLAVAPLTRGAARASLTGAGRTYSASRYAELTRTLPGLLAGLRAALQQSGDEQRETFAAMLSHAYALASSLSTKHGEDGLAWVLADRSLTAARESGKDATVAAATRTVAITMRRAGHHQGALGLLTSAAGSLDAGRGTATAGLIGAYGNLLCTAAYSSAQADDAGNAATFLDEATAAAGRLGDGVITNGVAPFGRSIVAVYKIGVFTALGDSATALAHAATVDPAELPGPERYGRFCIDTARAWAQHGKADRAVRALLSAERHAPEEATRPSVRDLVSTLLYAPTTTPAGLRDLATRIGVAV
ncbi:hypothetical protein GCM10010435_80290 [Winogradskya consettensis]|uniref:HTH cro/C1-type domain-containing protein n=1 Tax=Winogradskya consettensis TaxID=113560 RepID=A0A919VVG2_9ACTN|nr:helix-turn-helix transcriptional regulator [Actinoplanes consettensis]GIM77307.1 hypothetical protein Aco04nite_54690 [Actinoplanes consettensis]